MLWMTLNFFTYETIVDSNLKTLTSVNSSSQLIVVKHLDIIVPIECLNRLE